MAAEQAWRMFFKGVTALLWLLAILFLCMLLLGKVVDVFHGEEKDSLLDYSCEELEKGRITTEGEGGRYVTDVLGNWVSKEKLKLARIEKGCINVSLDEFHYTNR